MGQDPVKYALGIGGFGLLTTLACGLYIALINGGSRNLGLALGAVAGSCLLLVLQISFELKGTTASQDFVVEFVVDYQQKNVRSSRAFDQSIAAASSYRNVFVEAEASKTVAAAALVLTNADAPKITRDLGIVSIISYLLEEQFDWQLDQRYFKTSTGTVSQGMGVSTPKECTLINITAIQEKLQAAGNMFASVQMGIPGMRLCLPPSAVLDITQNSVAIRSFVCSVILTLQEPFSSMTSMDPHKLAVAKATGQPIKTADPILPNGSPRYAIVDIAARATVEFAALRAQDRDLAKYQKWANRLVDGVKARFVVLEHFPFTLHRIQRRRGSWRILAESSGEGRRRWLARGLGLYGRRRRAREP
jgi:hypothetical protein